MGLLLGLGLCFGLSLCVVVLVDLTCCRFA